MGRTAGQSLRLVEVRRHDGRKRKETGHQRLDRIVLKQPRTGAGDHDRVDHERHVRELNELVAWSDVTIFQGYLMNQHPVLLQLGQPLGQRGRGAGTGSAGCATPILRSFVAT